MKHRISILLLAAAMSLPVHAEQTAVNAEAEVQAEGNIFSRAWTGIKGFFGGGDEAAPAQPEASSADAASGEVAVEAGAAADDKSLVDKAADTTKAGVDWTAEKARQGAEWTKETAKDVTEATGKGVKKAGAAIEGLFPNANDTQVDAEASVDADAEIDTE